MHIALFALPLATVLSAAAARSQTAQLWLGEGSPPSGYVDLATNPTHFKVSSHCSEVGETTLVFIHAAISLDELESDTTTGAGYLSVYPFVTPRYQSWHPSSVNLNVAMEGCTDLYIPPDRVAAHLARYLAGQPADFGAQTVAEDVGHEVMFNPVPFNPASYDGGAGDFRAAWLRGRDDPQAMDTARLGRDAVIAAAQFYAAGNGWVLDGQSLEELAADIHAKMHIDLYIQAAQHLPDPEPGTGRPRFKWSQPATIRFISIAKDDVQMMKNAETRWVPYVLGAPGQRVYLACIDYQNRTPQNLMVEFPFAAVGLKAYIPTANGVTMCEQIPNQQVMAGAVYPALSQNPAWPLSTFKSSTALFELPLDTRRGGAYFVDANNQVVEPIGAVGGYAFVWPYELPAHLTWSPFYAANY
jgi:hypothetical protein